MRNIVGSINTIFSLGGSLVLLTALAGLIVYVSVSIYSTGLEDEVDSMSQLAEGLAGMSVDNLKEKQFSSVSLAQMKMIYDFLENDKDEEHVADIFKADLASYPEYEFVFAIDRKGVLVTGFNKQGEATKGLDLSGRPYVQDMFSTGKPQLSKEVFKSSVSGKFVNVLVASVKNGQGDIIGGVGMAMDWSAFIAKRIRPSRWAM